MGRKKSATPGAERYESKRKKVGILQREMTASAQEIGPLPKVANARRKARCQKSLRTFCEVYFPHRFKLAFARSHLAALTRLESCSREGELFACAMPRAEGKTTLAECAVMHAVLYGLRRFVVLVQATRPLAGRSLKKIQRELETNDLLLADFPEVCYPIRRLERMQTRARGQTLDGVPTRIEWTADQVTLPSVPKSKGSGAILYVAGLTGAVRGLSAVGPEGEILRPDMVLIDDAQTRDSAKSPTQTNDREAVINDDILGLAGPTTTIAAVMLCTVIYPTDLSDRFLSQERCPEWQGIRTKMIETWPDLALWDEYAEIRRESLRAGDSGKRATEFYRVNREKMDEGAVISWPDRMKKGELSGLQSAMNLFYRNPRGFRSEYQNDPDPIDGPTITKQLVAETVAARLSGLARYEVPHESSRLVCMIDPGVWLHWYAVVAWDERFGGSVIDYGSWPHQPRAVFSAESAPVKLADHYPGKSESERTYQGLMDLSAEVLGRAYLREGTGAPVKVERCLTDCGFDTSTVYAFCRASPYASILYPSKGIGRTMTARGVAEWPVRPGERSGWHWKLTAVSDKGRGKMAQFDPDMWKSFLFERLCTPMGGHGALTLFGRPVPGQLVCTAHPLLSEHCAAESAESKEVRGIEFDKWSELPSRPDNHLFDTLVGACVAASLEGLIYSATGQPEVRPVLPRPVKLSELQRQKREGRG